MKKRDSEPPSSMLFGGTSETTDKEGEDPQMMTTQEMEETTLLTKSLMAQSYRTMSPSPRPMTSSLWDPSHESLTEIDPEQTHSLLSTSGT